MTAGRGTRGMCSRAFASRERLMVAEPTYLTPGVVLQDRYEIADEIGRGGFSIVYRARDRRIGADVAIKLLVPPPAAARLARERLRREVQVVRQLSHPNIVAVYDVVDDGPWSFVVMEYVPGSSGPRCRTRTARSGPGTYSITTKLHGPSSTTSYTATMFGWLSCRTAWTSRRSRSRASRAAAGGGTSNLIATAAPTRRSRARYTMENPPRPISSAIS